MKNYSPQLGPFINMQGDISAKQMLNRMFTHSLEWKELTVNAFVRKSNIKPDVTKIYKSKDVPSWCLQDLPLIVVPHPDFDRYGEATRAQLRILSTLAIEESLFTKIQTHISFASQKLIFESDKKEGKSLKGVSKPVTNIHDLSNQVGLMKCSDGVVRRISVRYLHGSYSTNIKYELKYIIQIAL